MHPSEQSLPWKAQLPAVQPPAFNAEIDWGWPKFLNTSSANNQVIMSTMFHPHANMKSFVETRRQEHESQVDVKLSLNTRFF